jgi:hypothetical protein
MFKSFRMTALLVLTASVFVSLAATAHAQKPVTTKSTDEPGRSPYFSYASQSCFANVSCEVTHFKAVPAGFRLVVTHASASYSPIVTSVRFDDLVVLGQSSDAAGTFVFLPAPSSVGRTFVVSAPLTFYVDPGSTPILVFSNAAPGMLMFGSITGYLVAVD